MEKLTPRQTQDFRAAQKKRSRVVLAVIVIWIAGIFMLTVVKGQIAVERRALNQTQSQDHE